MAFTPKAFTFLGQIAKNNDKAWFEAHKADYEAHVREPALAFVEECAEWFEAEGLPYVAEAKKVGGSLSRIHRDVRFSKDKSPYNTHVVMGFHHRRMTEEKPLPGIGVRFDKDGASVGAGCWMGGTPVLNKVRDAIVADPKGWTAAKKGVTMGTHDYAPPLKTAPRGYAKDHPMIEDLKRTVYAADAPLTKAEFTGDLLKAFRSNYKRMEPFVGFLNEALES
jgi:uncharacterized protein (TIGR02453 family)